MTATGEILRDLRDLPPPRPLEVALEELAALPAGACLHLVLVHEPLPLLALLPPRGIEWRVTTTAPGEVHVLLWRAGDEVAARIVSS